MARARPYRQHATAGRRIGRVERALALSVVLLVMLAVLEKVDALMDQAEQATIRTTITNLETVLNVCAALYLMRGQRRALVELAASDPLAVAERGCGAPEAKGRAARGRYSGQGVGSAVEGGWRWNVATRTLEYHPRPVLHMPGGGPGQVRGYRVRMRFVDRNRNGVFDAPDDSFQGLRLMPETVTAGGTA